MDKLVQFCAPRGWVDYVLKAIALLLFLGASNWLRDMAEHGADADGFINNFKEAMIVGIAPTLLALGLLSHMRKLQMKLEKAAVTDPLTGLPNRRGFFDAVNAALPTPGGVLMMLDADHFKAVNDTFGHGAGDTCLIEIAHLLRAHLREGDIVARLGGEEFGLFLVNARVADARAIGERLVQGINLELDQLPAPHPVTLSAGAVKATGETDVAHLLNIADTALYTAKENGRARVVFADAGQSRTASSALMDKAS